MKTNDDLIDYIRSKKNIFPDSLPVSLNVLAAMQKTDRKFFVPQEFKSIAYEDNVVPIGYGQTCSQPSLLAFMVDVLDIQAGQKILEVGAGCGYASAIISGLVGDSGCVFACEIIPELGDNLEKNLSAYKNIKIIIGDGGSGFMDFAPFDRILFSAGVSNIFDPQPLIDQLSDNGILEYPERFGAVYVIKKQKDKLYTEQYYGVSFVPLTGKNG